MAPRAYHFVDRWRVEGTVEEVSDVLGDAEDMVRWWPSTYLRIRTLSPGDERGVGSVSLVHAKGWLPYTIRFAVRVTDVDPPNGFGLDALGELSGRGEWRFRQDGPWVDVTYTWTVSADKPLLRRLSWLLRPLFRSNHGWTMRRGEESMRLELARRRAGDAAARDAVPAPPGPVWPRPGRWSERLDRLRSLRLSHTRHVGRPVDEVFAYVTDVTHDLDWQPDIDEVEVTSSGPLGVGSTFREVRRTAGRRFVWDMLVTELVPDERIAIVSLRGMPYEGWRDFEPTDGGTLVRETSIVRLPLYLVPVRGIVRRLSSRAVARAYERLELAMASG